MYKATLNFDTDFDEILIHELSDHNFSVDPTSDSDKIRMKYFNYKRRLIQPVPRSVLTSKEFNCPAELQKGLEIVKTKIQNGDNLTPHLSKNLTNLDYNDSLLNDWKIYHLHLGEHLEPNGSGFIERAGPVLFVRIEENKALLINILPHGSWTKQQMVKVIHDNWPESIESYLLKDVIGLSHVPTDDDIKDMRKFGVNSAIEIEPGVVYAAIGGGLTSAKTSVEVTMALIYYNRLLPKLQKYVEDNLQEIGKIVTDKTGRENEELSLKLVTQNSEYFVVEQNTGLPFRLGKH
ncbi:hypothetical protein [Fulvivirga sp.]|uniref:hypothetical protein n=1 Tax=Fulvivirga sp. TaxID=1931237 RepID=UPI0032EAD318